MLAQRLKQLRSSTPYTQAQLADVIGVARTTYAMYEQGKREPDNETLNKIADYFKVTTDYLLGRVEKPHGNYNSQEQPLKVWLRQENADLSEVERNQLGNEIEDYLAMRRKRILEAKTKEK